jgi:hypothetical protein
MGGYLSKITKSWCLWFCGKALRGFLYIYDCLVGVYGVYGMEWNQAFGPEVEKLLDTNGTY